MDVAGSGLVDVLESILRLDLPLSRRGYLEALEGFQLFPATWERRVTAALLASLSGWSASRSRSDRLHLDLLQLGKGHLVPLLARDACAKDGLRINLANIPATFGSIYVLEASAPDGTVVARTTRDSLRRRAGNGPACLKGTQSETAALRSAFRVMRKDRVGTDIADRQGACEMAQHSFDALIETFRKAGCGFAAD